MQIPERKVICLEVIHAPKAHTSREVARKAVVCFNCNEIGHYKCECLHWKTRMCWHWQGGKCKEKLLCSFAHGESDRRTPPF